MSLQRARALSLFRAIARQARGRWRGPHEERDYIRNEAFSLYRQNAALTDRHEIQEKLQEAETRLELALHYGIPYPRLYHTGKMTGVELNEHGVQHKASYMHSYYDRPEQSQSAQPAASDGDESDGIEVVEEWGADSPYSHSRSS
eukprot:TRINITY_DN4720_c0_g1_i2.p1 TRINITY_DN4720_c0_g1~~TRINITY_DN4720_c0_g1_i2.p1  ORF type:complete len:145 (-),score=36.11 TRINITY_DN4720_c0_g1_i2:169-603(-)